MNSRVGPLLSLGLIAAVISGPRGRSWWPWLAVVPVWVGMMAPPPMSLSEQDASARFDRRCRTILSVAQTVTADPRVGDLVIGTGATLNPSQPFDLLARIVAGEPDLTIFLADERGRLVAWGGQPFGFPVGMRALGDRRWELVRTAGTVTVVLREPLLQEGRLAGSVIVSERSSNTTTSAFGLTAPPGWEADFSLEDAPEFVVESKVAPGIGLPVSWMRRGNPWRLYSAAFGWAILGVIGMVFLPVLALPSVLGLFVAIGGNRLGICVRFSRLPGGRGGRTMGFETRADWCQICCRFNSGNRNGCLFPGKCRLGFRLAPGAYPGSWAGRSLACRNRLDPFSVAVFQVGAGASPGGRVSGRDDCGPAFDGAACCRAFYIGRRRRFMMLRNQGISIFGRSWAIRVQESRSTIWHRCLLRTGVLRRCREGPRVLAFNASDQVVSSWGDLGPAGNRVSVVREWTVDWENLDLIQLRLAEEPWSLLGDWPTRGGMDSSRESPMWWVVLSRSGAVACVPSSGCHSPGA